MERTLVEKIADAVLYEGYMLYPYRASSVKNKLRFNWGALAPKEYSDAQKGTEAWEMQTQCPMAGDQNTELKVKVRFLQLVDRGIGKIDKLSDHLPPDHKRVPTLEIDGELYQAWREAVERDIELPTISPGEADIVLPFSFPESHNIEAIKNKAGKIAGVIIRTQREISGEIRLGIDTQAGNGIAKATLLIRNTTPHSNASAAREDALMSSLVSTHAILSLTAGEFVSLLEPPEEFAGIVSSCENKGVFPVLVGTAGQRTCMLASPIILYDYPEIASESPGDLFDSTEIDEILTLRIMTMTEQEKREMRSVDDRVRKILERTEGMSEDELLTMHGTLRGMERSRKASNG